MQHDQGKNNTNKFSNYTVTATATRHEFDAYVHPSARRVATRYRFDTCVLMLAHYHMYSNTSGASLEFLRQESVA